jgi:hypothetical protein
MMRAAAAMQKNFNQPGPWRGICSTPPRRFYRINLSKPTNGEYENMGAESRNQKNVFGPERVLRLKSIPFAIVAPFKF